MADSKIDFFDAGLQQSAPQRTILHFLRSLTATYQKLTTHTHEEEQALGVLLIANGVQILDADASPPGSPEMARSSDVRLTSTGVNWQTFLAEYESANAVKVRGAVLGFVFDVYRRNRDAWKQEATVPPPTEPAPARDLATENEEPEGNNGTSQAAPSEAETGGDPAVAPRQFIHKPWPGSDSWHNWGVGVDEEGAGICSTSGALAMRVHSTNGSITDMPV